MRNVRAAVSTEHEVAIHDLVLINAGSIARTTSGKLSRAGTRTAYLGGALERINVEVPHATTA